MTGFKKSFQKLLKLVKRSDDKEKKKKLSEETSNTKIIEQNEATISSLSKENILTNDLISKDSISESGKDSTLNGLSSNKILDLFVENNKEIERVEEDKEVTPASCDVLLPSTISDNTATNKPTAIVKPCHKPEHEQSNVLQDDCEPKIIKNDDIIDKKSVVEEIIEPLTNNELHETATKDEVINHANTEDNNESVSPEIDDQQIVEKVEKIVVVTQENLDELSQKIVQVDDEILKYKTEIERVNTSNEQMLIVIDEFESTISQIVKDKEKENVYLFIQKENAERDRNIVMADLDNVERAFNDLSSKYERTKDVVASFAQAEDSLKQDLDVLTNRLKQEEEKYDKKKAEAEKQLAEANENLSGKQKSADREIARLNALIRKAEMNVASMEEKIKLKTSENADLTAMCDDLLGRLDSIAAGNA